MAGTCWTSATADRNRRTHSLPRGANGGASRAEQNGRADGEQILLCSDLLSAGRERKQNKPEQNRADAICSVLVTLVRGVNALDFRSCCSPNLSHAAFLLIMCKIVDTLGTKPITPH